MSVPSCALKLVMVAPQDITSTLIPLSPARHGTRCIQVQIKKANEKRTVTVRRVIFFLNFSRHPSLI
jgi:hypothetical protein